MNKFDMKIVSNILSTKFLNELLILKKNFKWVIYNVLWIMPKKYTAHRDMNTAKKTVVPLSNKYLACIYINSINNRRL